MAEVTFTHESQCEECGEWKLSEGKDFTLSVSVKERFADSAPADHDCHFTHHEELDEPVVEEV